MVLFNTVYFGFFFFLVASLGTAVPLQSDQQRGASFCVREAAAVGATRSVQDGQDLHQNSGSQC